MLDRLDRSLFSELKEFIFRPGGNTSSRLTYEARDTIRFQTTSEVYSLHSLVSSITFPCNSSSDRTEHRRQTMPLWEFLVLATDAHHALGDYNATQNNCSTFAETLMQAAAAWTNGVIRIWQQLTSGAPVLCRSCNDRNRKCTPINFKIQKDSSVISPSRARCARFMRAISAETLEKFDALCWGEYFRELAHGECGRNPAFQRRLMDYDYDR
ncbi:hypothetical protein NP233_g10078 [Leucocoprinus birnbaumii]|uniref:Uncharacterized protein n=1 Tax=Leucocoprinus birnbaumii TaxID=56174 RepID=A0AAD5VPW0_9AGAR|nr:hypothetical protein NP233_g10078 [Leucocoprinus birnbaumii]